MRRSVSRVVTLVAAVSFAAGLTGCQTSGSMKSPTSPSTWFSWGKKKPSSSTFAGTKPDTNLPAPPSGSMTPSSPPSYAQSGGTRAGAAQAPYTPAAAANPTNYGERRDGTGQYSNASYNTGPTAAPYQNNSYQSNPAASGGYAQGNAGTAQGFYSPNRTVGTPDTRGTTPSYGTGGAGAPAGGYGAPGGYAPAGSYGATAGSQPAYGNANRSYSDYGSGPAVPSTYGQSGNTGGTAGQNWNAGDVGQYSVPARSSYDASAPYSPPGASYGQAPQRNAAFDRTQQSASDNHGGSRSEPAAYGGPSGAAGGSAPGSPNALTGGSYRPGSTSRPTQYGTADNINVAGVDSVRRASFSGGDNGNSGLNDGSQSPAGGSYGGSAPRTATGGSAYSYPSSYDR